MIRSLSLALVLFAGHASAESHLLDADALAALVDERVGELSPYEAILNDPDPARSMAAMEIMLASGDPALLRSAIAFGFQAADPALKRMATQGVLDSGVPLTVALSVAAEDQMENFAGRARSYLGAAVGPEGRAFVTIRFGAYNPELGCYGMISSADRCVVALNADGIFVTMDHLTARLGFSEGAAFTGGATVTNVSVPIQADMVLWE